MVIGNQGRDPELARAGDSIDTADAIVYGDNKVRLAGGCQVDDVGRQAIATGKAIRHQIIHAGAKRAQRTEADRTRGSAVAVVVGDDQDARASSNRVGEKTSRRRRVRQRRRGQQRVESVFDLTA